MKHTFQNIKSEFKKISWPTRKDLIHDVPFFIIAFLLATLSIYLLDSAFNFGIMKIISFIN